MNKVELIKIANNIRKSIIEEIYEAKSGHPGGSLSAVEIFSYLYFNEMNIYPSNPECEERDRFVLSKGHVSPAYYATLAEKGFIEKDELKTLRKVGSRLQGHPCMTSCPGVDMSSGSLGQGISVAVGMALGNKLDKKEQRVYTLLGDGELQEGQVWEAAMLAGHLKLDNLVVIVDNNGLQIDGKIEEVCSPYPIESKFKSFNFNTIVVNGHDFDEIDLAFKNARETKGLPTAIIAQTTKGKGISFIENQVGWHGKALNKDEYLLAIKELGEES